MRIQCLFLPYGAAITRLSLMAACLACVMGSAHAQGYTFKSSFGTPGSGVGQINYPAFLTFDPNGNLIVDDYSNNRVQRFTHDGTFLQTIGTGQLSQPLGVATDAGNNLYVSNLSFSRVDVFDSAGSFVRTAASSVNAAGLALGATGNLYVSQNHSTVKVFDSAGSLIQTIGNGSSQTLWGIALDGNGHLYGADPYNNRLEEYDSSGTFLRNIGSGGSGNGQLSTPNGIRLDSSGNIYTTDLGNRRVVEFDSSGAFVQNIGVGRLDSPYDLVFDSAGNLLVSDYGTRSIVEFDVTPATPEPSAWAALTIGACLVGLRRKKRAN